jgi:hypothetical protein
MPSLCSLVIEIFLWHVILREFFRRNFRHIRVRRIFDTTNHPRLEGLSFFEKFFDTLRIRLGGIWYSLGIPGLPSRFSFEIAVRFVMHETIVFSLGQANADARKAREPKHGTTL